MKMYSRWEDPAREVPRPRSATLPGERRGRKVAKLVGAVVVSTALVGFTSGCAIAARALMAAEAVNTVHDLIADLPVDPPVGEVAATGATAAVRGTHGSGLKLEGRPGADHLLTVPEGATVTVLCDVTGPTVSGSGRASSTWSRVRTTGGRTGYMSNAYLDMYPGGTAVSRC